MKPGDLVRLSSDGGPVWISRGQGQVREAPCHVPSGTLAIVLDILSLGAEAHVMVNGTDGYIWISECEVVNETG